MEWNRCFNMIERIKKDYDKIIGGSELNLESWVEDLGIDEYIEFLAPLQLNHCGNFVLIRYGLAEMQRGMWTDPESVYRHCRSTVIDLKNMALVLHPFTKFFNMNEVEETSTENIIKKLKVAKVVEIADKLDGSMYSARFYRDEIFTSTSMALAEENSWRLADANRMLKSSEGTQKMIHDYAEYTFGFEYISIEDAHVVLYNKEQEGLYLIGITDMRNGRELNYCEVIEIADKYGVKSTYTEDLRFEDLLEKSQTIGAHEKEGWVINIDGHRFKIKGDDYVKMHRVIDSISSVNVVIAAIADGNYDDLISKLPDAYRGRVDKLAQGIYDWVEKTERDVEKIYVYAPKNDIKRFMFWTTMFPKRIRGCLQDKYLGEETSLLRSRSGAYTRATEIFGKNAEELMMND